MAAREEWKVGELAKATGLTVRALHHYDEMGLLVPSERTQAGHRLYSQEDVRRLYRIVALRRLSLPLDEVANLLDDESLSLADTVRGHLKRVERDLGRQARLRQRLVSILAALDQSLEPSINEFIDALEVMAITEASVEDVLVPAFREAVTAEPGCVPPDGQPVMLLKEREGERLLPIWIGHPEGAALALQLAGTALPRPMTQDLMVRLVEAAGARIERVCVSRFGENTFFAAVTVNAQGESQEVDARPSDALNLAVRVGAPIFVDSQVMDEWAVPSREAVASRLTECVGPHRAHPKREAPSEWRSLTVGATAPPLPEIVWRRA